MKIRDEVSFFYNSGRPPSPSGEDALNPAKGLDFSGEVSVNAEDVIGGTPMNAPTLANPAIDNGNSLDGLERLIEDPDIPADAVAGAQAVLYLRVSTPRQLHTAADIDEDGNSIATQRVEAMRKVRTLKATVAREFVEPGQSAQTISKRAEFKKMLRYLDEHPEVKYVVIYMRSRVFRNFTDAAITKRELLEKGVRLISAKEEFGDGYMADAMEAITDIMNEVQVRMNGEDVKVKMAHKVEQGGSVGRAKLGYLNVRKDFGGRLVNTIDVDPVRAPLVAWAFEQYATGQYSISQLRDLMEEQGLTTRASPSRAERPVSNSRLAGILRDPYYTGVNRYKGKLYVGRHEAIISKETFLKVQEILDQRNREGDRDIKHFHYLKGVMFCGECSDAGRRSRLLYSQNTGNGGTYEYFICTAKQRRLCKTPAVRVEQIEAHIVDVIARERFDSAAIDAVSDLVTEAVGSLLAADRDAKTQLRKQLEKLEAQEERLIDLAATGALEVTKLSDRIAKTTLQKEAVKEKLARATERLNYGAERALAHLELLRDPGNLYRHAPEAARRDLLAAFFNKLTVHIEDDRIRIESDRTTTNTVLQALCEEIAPSLRDTTDDRDSSPSTADHVARNTKTPRLSAGSHAVKRSELSSLVPGLSKTHVAGVPGLEPRMAVPETAVLPITPYPNGTSASGRQKANLPYFAGRFQNVRLTGSAPEVSRESMYRNTIPSRSAQGEISSVSTPNTFIAVRTTTAPATICSLRSGVMPGNSCLALAGISLSRGSQSLRFA